MCVRVQVCVRLLLNGGRIYSVFQKRSGTCGSISEECASTSVSEGHLIVDIGVQICYTMAAEWAREVPNGKRTEKMHARRPSLPRQHQTHTAAMTSACGTRKYIRRQGDSARETQRETGCTRPPPSTTTKKKQHVYRHETAGGKCGRRIGTYLLC